MLDVMNLTKEYDRGGAVFAAVADATLAVAGGEVVAVVGRSGSGKTTFLTMVAGLLKPTRGRVVVDGVDIRSLKDAELSLLRNRCIGYVPQGQSLLANLTVFDNVRLPFYFAPRDDNVAGRTAFLLEEVGLSHLAGMYPAQLSGGEMRRVAIARALMNRPKILLADEPTGDLDAANSTAVMDIFGNLAAKGMAVVFSTHEDDAARRADRVVEMVSGTMTELAGLEAAHG
ncbi:MAG: ABC transporter ATP-binding protein [Planctomycetes bacterium]|nr:ABC transporter ATP-binding protein [Planctomycetota bacterium]